MKGRLFNQTAEWQQYMVLQVIVDSRFSPRHRIHPSDPAPGAALASTLPSALPSLFSRFNTSHPTGGAAASRRFGRWGRGRRAGPRGRLPTSPPRRQNGGRRRHRPARRALGAPDRIPEGPGGQPSPRPGPPRRAPTAWAAVHVAPTPPRLGQGPREGCPRPSARTPLPPRPAGARASTAQEPGEGGAGRRARSGPPGGERRGAGLGPGEEGDGAGLSAGAEGRGSPAGGPGRRPPQSAGALRSQGG